MGIWLKSAEIFGLVPAVLAAVSQGANFRQIPGKKLLSKKHPSERCFHETCRRSRDRTDPRDVTRSFSVDWLVDPELLRSVSESFPWYGNCSI